MNFVGVTLFIHYVHFGCTASESTYVLCCVLPARGLGPFVSMSSGAHGVLTGLSLHAGVDKKPWPNSDCRLKGMTRRRSGLFSGRYRCGTGQQSDHMLVASEAAGAGLASGFVLPGGCGDGVTQRPRGRHPTHLSSHGSSKDTHF